MQKEDLHSRSKIVHREGSIRLILLFNAASLSVCSWHRCGTVMLLYVLASVTITTWYATRETPPVENQIITEM